MKDGKIEEPPLVWGLPDHESVHVFRYKNVKLWELTVETLLEANLVGLLPLCLLTQGGMKHEVAEDIFDSLVGEKELLALALTFASMVFDAEADKQWLRRRIGMLEDIVRETWFYKDIYQEGKEEGLEEGMQALRLAVLDVIQERFPEVIDLAEKQIAPIKDAVILRRLIVKMSATQTAEKARQYIQELGKENA